MSIATKAQNNPYLISHLDLKVIDGSAVKKWSFCR